jgi:hypothetical protein
MTTFTSPPRGLFVSLVLACAANVACSADHVLGDDGVQTGAAGKGGHDGGGTPSAGGTSGQSAVVDAAAEPEVGPLGPSESWTGYIENYTFPSGSDQLKLTFATDPSGNVVGAIVFGQGTPPPAATDPNVGYPPELVSNPNDPSVAVVLAEQNVDEGYPYSVDDGLLTSQRLRFKVPLVQLWAGWCALQTPPSDGSHFCLPSWNSRTSSTACAQQNPKTNQWVPVDCDKLWLCSIDTPCVCSASGCAADPNGIIGTASFDLVVSGATASGGVTGPPATGTAHFTKDP